MPKYKLTSFGAQECGWEPIEIDVLENCGAQDWLQNLVHWGAVEEFTQPIESDKIEEIQEDVT